MHSFRHISKAFQLYGPDRLVHVYGPTECTTFATYYPVRRIRADDTKVPIGLPIQNTRIYLINEGTLCEPGETGEICLAGAGLSSGYLGRPDISREPFVKWDVGEAREWLYRTGDYGHFLPDGNVIIQGRQDDQIKISGFRIELGELAHHLDCFPGVRHGFVAVRENVAGAKELWAFVCPNGDQCTSAAIREYLSACLPSYMIPAMICLCESLPLSPNGKVDRHALFSMHPCECNISQLGMDARKLCPHGGTSVRTEALPSVTRGRRFRAGGVSDGCGGAIDNQPPGACLEGHSIGSRVKELLLDRTRGQAH